MDYLLLSPSLSIQVSFRDGARCKKKHYLALQNHLS